MPNPNPPRRQPAPGSRQRLPSIRLVNARTGLYERRYTPTPGAPRRSFYGTLEAVLAFDPVQTPERIDRRLTLADYLRLWCAGLDGRANTNAYHRGNVERYLIPTFGEHVRLVDVNREGLRAGYATLRERGGSRGPLAPRTIASAHATLRRALSQAADDRRIPANPAIGLNPNGTAGAGARSRRVGLELPIPSDAEIRALAQAAAGDRLYPLFMLSALTGLRQSEALALRWSDLALGPAGGIVRVSRTLERTTRTIEDPKTARSARAVPFDLMLGEILRAHRTAQRHEQLLAGPAWRGDAGDGALVFATPDGSPLVGSTISHRFARLCKVAGVGPYRWHDLRHAYASALLNRNVSSDLVSKRLGHADVSITSRVYHHVAPPEPHDDAARSAAAMFADPAEAADAANR